jgi:peptidoglycan/LPS O-acetylase OafA/YrhL
MLPKPRNETLDYLRGLLALSVMAYHYLSWAGVMLPWPLNQTLQRLGIYGVSAFYVLSGAALGLVYANREVNRPFLREFAAKRFWRIVPLFWLASFLAILPPLWVAALRHNPALAPDPLRVLLNFSLLFAWVQPHAALTVGGWSIGNELVFYSLFPFLLLALRSRGRWLVAVGMAALTAFFAFRVLSPAVPLPEQWVAYVHPLNQIHFFAGGVGIGLFTRAHPKLPALPLQALALATALLFVSWPAATPAALVSGWARLLFSLLALAACFAAATWGRPLPGWPARALRWLGGVSYSLYLLHPLVWYWLTVPLRRLHSPLLILALAVPVSLALAHLCYQRLELPAQRWGRRRLEEKPDAAAQRAPCS